MRNKHRGLYRTVAWLIFVPILLRTGFGLILPAEREATGSSLGSLVIDPSFLAFFLSGLLALVQLFRVGLGSLRELARVPLGFFLLYAICGVTFSIFSSYWVFGLYVSVEYLIYCLIAALAIAIIRKSDGEAMACFENGILGCLAIFIIIACVDLVLPFTSPLSDIDGRARFAGSLITMEENHWSVIAGGSALINLARFISQNRRYKSFYLMLTLMSLCIFVLAGSRSGFVAFALAFSVLIYRSWSSLGMLTKVSALLGVLIALPLVALIGTNKAGAAADFVLRSNNLGNVGSLGGRLGLWEAVWNQIALNPFWGYGFGSKANIGFDGSLHNFLLEAWLATGAFGVAMFILGLFFVVKALILGSSKKYRCEYSKEVITAFVLIVFVLIHSITESSIAGVNNAYYVVMWYCVIIAQGQLSLNARGPVRNAVRRASLVPVMH